MTTAETLTLTDFLLTRIAEDEAVARWGRLEDDPADPTSLTKVLRWDHQRLGTECEAKRRIVRHAAQTTALSGATDYTQGSHQAAQFALRAIASVYADHPDYRKEWKP